MTDLPERPFGRSVKRGWCLKCPNCGSGPMMRGYLKTRDHCTVCGEELLHHRADDGPAYVTILVSSHLLAPLILITFTTFRPDPLPMAVAFSTLFIAFALYALPRFKGVFVGIQWAKRMHGFGRPVGDRNGPTGANNRGLHQQTVAASEKPGE